MRKIDVILLALYLISISCSVYILFKHREYYHERFRKRVISVFMLVMLLFLLAFTFNMLFVLMSHLTVIAGVAAAGFKTGLLYGWTITQLGITVGLLALAVLTRSGRFDQFIYLRRLDRKGERHADAKRSDK